VQGRCSHLSRYPDCLSKAAAEVGICQRKSAFAVAHFITSSSSKAIPTTTGFISFLCAILLLSQPAQAAVEDNTILALEPLEGMVVVKTGAGELEVIAIGDAFPDSDVIVIQVLADKVVAQEVVGEEKKITQQVWVYKAGNAASGSRVERLLLSLSHNGTLVPNTQDTHSMVPDSQGGVQ
jgi:predicted RNA-binding protein